MASFWAERKSGGWWMTVQGARVDSGSWPPVSEYQDRSELLEPQLWSVLRSPDHVCFLLSGSRQGVLGVGRCSV